MWGVKCLSGVISDTNGQSRQLDQCSHIALDLQRSSDHTPESPELERAADAGSQRRLSSTESLASTHQNLIGHRWKIIHTKPIGMNVTRLVNEGGK
jgi:hypothetical protein